MISRGTGINLKIFAIGTLGLNAACMSTSSEQLSSAQIMDASYRCTSTYASANYKNDGFEYVDEWEGAELNAMLRNEGMSATFTFEIRDSTAYIDDETTSTPGAIPITRQGNKIFFKPKPQRSGSVSGKMTGLFDLTTNRLQQSIETENREGSLKGRFSSTALCSPQ